MTKSVKLLVDDDCEMLCVEVNGEVYSEGNFWDFDFQSDLIKILTKLGINVEVEDYEYED
ncbi:hypothetical protein D3C85_1283000 [compost metagenome]